MEALKMLPYIFLMLAISGIIAGASLITTSKFQDTMTQCYNTSYGWNSSRDNGICFDSSGVQAATGKSSLNLSSEYYAMTQVSEGTSEVAEQFPTIGIIAVMVIIISLIAGVFVYMKFFS